MNILVLNRGSSTLKCALFEFTAASQPLSPRWETLLEWKNNAGSSPEAIGHLIRSQNIKVDAIGHRIVHGGKYFKDSVLIDAEVKKKIALVSELAPLHNLPELDGIEIMEKQFPGIPQVAIFDTAFHSTLPNAAKIYPGPYAWWTDEGIQRYGFHGISYQYCSKRAAELAKLENPKMIICHLGSGASLCAIQEGKSIDTTMGFTPLEGLMMDTRSGTIDPGIILHLLDKKKMTAKQIYDTLYYNSGLLGISGASSDMREIIEKAARKDLRAQTALDIYIHRLNALIGSMAASLQGLDILVFTAGIGENAPLIREKVCSAFAFLGVELDKKKNEETPSADADLSARHSRVKVLLIHTQEAYEMARECWKKVFAK